MGEIVENSKRRVPVMDEITVTKLINGPEAFTPDNEFCLSGGPAVEMALGAFFSAAEVIPLTLLTVEAWSFLQLGTRQGAGGVGAVPASLGGAVPGLGRVLELPRRGSSAS